MFLSNANPYDSRQLTTLFKMTLVSLDIQLIPAIPQFSKSRFRHLQRQ